jgi:uncharacterized membrane protein
VRRGKRYPLLDVIRGFTIVSMVGYHAAWDLVYLAGVDWPWYHSDGAHLWQQSICWTFILLSGYCMTLSVHRWRRGAVVSAAGLLVTGATLVFLPDERVIFGVLTFLGSAMLITALLYRLLERLHPLAGMLICAGAFYLVRPVNSGALRLPSGNFLPLPSSWYHGMAAAYLGFLPQDFYSTDYFSLLPWIFLFWTGLYVGLLMKRAGRWKERLLGADVPPLSLIGQHSLMIYLLHQPILYMAVVLFIQYR